eukprot:174021-Pyramimonas_sp.AAC.1
MGPLGVYSVEPTFRSRPPRAGALARRGTAARALAQPPQRGSVRLACEGPFAARRAAGGATCGGRL